MSLDNAITRRNALAAAGAGAAAIGGAALLAGCGPKDSNSPTAQKSGGNSTEKVQANQELVALDKVPVGSAVSATGPGGVKLIVSQPKKGKAVAFSAICTHQGCTVAPAGKELHCPCHGSIFEASTGAVVRGPAQRPLPGVKVHVENGNVITGG